ncbi:MAG: SDR family oxidoreductase [Chloroflexi bacterium]|nr:SDR family oxidoreductase [Chloroflexota bacterium]MCY4246225.1 SDR family oxidoreductase [Chloroflexota bacterium]
MSSELAGKAVIITGASSGIGAALARALSAAGCRLTLAARSLDKLQALADELPGETLAVRADMLQPAAIEAMVRRAQERFGAVDALCANAGIFIQGDFAEYDMNAVSDMLRINIEAVLRCAHAVIPIMRGQSSGDILVTSSIAGHAELHRGPAYGATKHAIETIVNTLRRQLAGAGIRVMSLAPGKVANELWGYEDAADIERLSVAEGGWLRSDDVAAAGLFMLSRPRHVTVRTLVMLPRHQEA